MAATTVISERLASGSSVIHSANPTGKILGGTILTTIIALSASLPCLLTGLTMGIGLVGLARLPVRHILPRLAAVNFFILFLWLVLPLTGGGQPLMMIGPVPISEHGVVLALRITIKTNGIILLVLALFATIPVPQVGQVLRRLSIPPTFVLLLLTTYRYLTLIEEEFTRLRVAAKLRCFQAQTSLHTYRTYAHLLGMTLIRSLERSRRIHDAMRMRGFDGTYHVLDSELSTKNSWNPISFLLGACCLLLAIQTLFW